MSTSRSEKIDDPKIQLKKILSTYLNDTEERFVSNELEIRFATRGIKKITKTNFDNVAKKLFSSGFYIKENENHLLRINNEYLDNSGRKRLSNIRTEMEGLKTIQEYCRKNTLPDKDILFSKKDIQFTQKNYYKKTNKEGQVIETIKPANFDDFNFRVSLQSEKTILKSSGFAKNIINNWNDNKKIFRYLNRTTFIHKDLPIQVDMSIVKESTKMKTSTGRYYSQPQYNINDSNVFNNPEKYEIEVEFIKEKTGTATPYNTENQLDQVVKKMVRIILSGLQETNYPVSYSEQEKTIQSYMNMLYGKKKEEHSDNIQKKTNKHIVRRSNFIGPSSYTLQLQHIVSLNDEEKKEITIPNIRKNYTVTDKADGMRKMLFIDDIGKIYFIDTIMNIQFTGAKTNNMALINTLLDGEHILHDKRENFINLYAVFDVYFIKGKDVRSYPFAPLPNEKDVVKTQYRLTLLNRIIDALDMKPVSKKALISPLRIESKLFQIATPTKSIFDCCNYILSNVKNGLYEYETDGLIFTPSNMGVNMEKPLHKLSEEEKKETIPLRKMTWSHSFKWKPPKFNTIDFLITTQKNINGQDVIHNKIEKGMDVSSERQIVQYKTLVLRVGFDEKKHGYLHPCNDMYEDIYSKVHDKDNRDTYRPVPFHPTKPYDPEASICNIRLKQDHFGNMKMFTTEGDIIEDNMIVECSYDLNKDKLWNWVPLRVRYDKTREFRQGMNNFGNAYHVANSNWHSIHNPVTENMIRKAEDIPSLDMLGDDDVYYNRYSSKTYTQPLRNFHNLFVKNKLISSVSKKGDLLIDYAVGKGGDLPKWIHNKLGFVFGIDISKDNIENRMDGACARYLNYRKKHRVMPKALFLNGDSSRNIRNGEALYSERSKNIARAVFGEGPKDKDSLGVGVYHQYSRGKEGFHISSIQFAIHYMFKDSETFHQFMRNISECTKLDGYFIGTCYDGMKIFNMLRNKQQDESISIKENGDTIWEITKKYDNDRFNQDDETCFGYSVDVFQETINKSFREYLVNFNYFKQMVENYGFVLLTKSGEKELGLKSIGTFEEMFRMMKRESKAKNSKYGEALNMSANEKKISFLNKYFIFKKVRSVNAQKVAFDLINSANMNEIEEQELQEETNKDVQKVIKKQEQSKPKIVKKKKRLALKKAC